MRVIVVAVLLLVLAAPAPAAKQQPSLRVVGTSPLTVRGAAFPARMAVVVTVRQDGLLQARRTVRSGSAGGFAVTFAGTGVHPCDGGAMSITAVSSSGAVAKAKLPQAFCPPPLAALRNLP